MGSLPLFTSIPRDARRLVIANELWWVYEDPRVDSPYFGPALVFNAESVARRVRRYLQDWRELADEPLYALSWSR